MQCANINHPDYKNLSAAVGDIAAHYLWDVYDGNVNFAVASNGASSNFFTDAKTAFGDEGAIVAAAEIRMPKFLKHFGDWVGASSGLADRVDSNGEPHISEYIKYKRPNDQIKVNNTDYNYSPVEKKIQQLQKVFAKLNIYVDVRLDKKMPERARVEYENGKPVIYLGPNAGYEVVAHEFAHLYIDLLGYNHPLVQEGITQLRNTDLYRKVEAKYGELSRQELDMEVLTTAIGMEADKLFTEQESKERWVNWATKLLNEVAKILGLTDNVAKQLAQELISGQFQPNMQGTISTKTRYSRELEELENKAKAQNIQLVEDGSHYTINGSSEHFLRLTEKVREWFSEKYKGDSVPSYKKSAMKDFRAAGLTEEDTLVLGEESYTFDQYVEQKKIEENTWARVYGTVAHLFIERAIRPSPELDARIAELAAGKPGESLPIDVELFDYITDNVETIFADLGINILADGLTAEKRDEMIPEFKIVSEAMGVGTSIDNLVRHSDGIYSIIDWKTGKGFYNDSDNVIDMLNGGEHQLERIYDTKLNKAKLEVMYRAMMLKAEYDPNMRFRRLSVVHLGNRQQIAMRHEVNIAAYLGIIEDYMSKPENGMLEAYEKLKEKNLFDAAEYGAVEELADAEIAALPVDTRLKKLAEKITQATLAFKFGKQKQSKETIQRDLEHYTKAYEATRAAEAVQLDLTSDIRDISDMSWFKAKVVGNRYSSHDPAVQMYMSSVKAREREMHRRIDAIRRQQQEKFKPVLDEYMAKNTGSHVLSKVSAGGLNAINTQDLYSFMWEKKSTVNKSGYYAKHITQDEVNAGIYSQAQYEYNKWYHDTMRNLYKDVVGKKAYSEFRKDVSIAKLNSLPEELEDDFMPRVPPELGELAQRKLFSKDVIGRVLDGIGNIFLEDLYSDAKVDKGIPIKYIGSDKIIASSSHTFDTNVMLDRFAASLIRKDELDDMLHLGRSLVTILENKKAKTYEGKYENTVSYLNDMIMLNVLDMKKDNTMNRLPMRIKFNGKYYKISPVKMMMSSKHFIGAATMWLKPIPATRNAALIAILNGKEATKGSIAKLLGINSEDIDFTMRDLKEAHIEYSKTCVRLPGSKKTKLQALAERLHYMPDDYVYSKESTMLGQRNPAFTVDSLYFMHKIGEEYGSLIVLAAQLKHRKFTNTDGKTMSIWDGYDDEGNWTGGTRGIEAGTGQTVTGLTPNEVTHLERVSQRLHGGYRKSERSVLESTALGLIALQFKKYMPVLLENAFQSDFLDNTMGKYEKNEKGELQWIARRNEGRLRTFIKWFMQLLLMRKDAKYSYKKLSAEKKQHIIEVWITMSTMLMSRILIAGMDDDDEDSRRAVHFKRLMEDTSQGYDPRDLFRSLQNGTVVMPKMFKTMTAAQDWLIDAGLRGKKTKTGRNVGARTLENAIPLSSSYHSTMLDLGYENNR